MRFKTEADLAKPVISMLEEAGWEVYQEVQCHAYGGVADIVAVKSDLVHVVECKKSMGLRVMAQAVGWKRWATLVSVAVPFARRSQQEAILLGDWLKSLGLGHIQVITGAYGGARQLTQPKLQRHAYTATILKVLCPEMKTYAEAGGKAGYWTPYKRTLSNLATTVKQHSGATWKEILTHLHHHYGADSTASSILTRDILADRVPGVELKRDGRKWRLYAKETEDEGEDHHTKAAGDA